VLHRIIHISLPDSQQNSEAFITTNGDAMTRTETITFADVIAFVDVPELTSLKKVYRQLVLLFYKVRGYLSNENYKMVYSELSSLMPYLVSQELFLPQIIQINTD